MTALALAWALPISVLAGFLGVDPGFLLMPTLILLGFEPKRAAADEDQAALVEFRLLSIFYLRLWIAHARQWGQ